MSSEASRWNIRHRLPHIDRLLWPIAASVVFLVVLVATVFHLRRQKTSGRRVFRPLAALESLVAITSGVLLCVAGRSEQTCSCST